MIYKKLNGFLVLLFVCFCSVDLGQTSELPSFIHPCYRNDPNVKKCLLKESRRILKRFAVGMPELGVESFDPLRLGDINVNTANNLKISLRNAVMRGFKDFNMVDLNIDLVKKTGEMRLRGNTTFKSDYKMDGRILLFPIKGQGESRIKMINLDLIIDWDWNVVPLKDGKDHAVITKTSNRYTMDRALIKMEGLLSNDKTLGDTLNSVLNSNWKILLDDIGPPVVKVVEKKIIEIINQFYAKVPYDDMLPIDPSKN